MPSRTAVAVKEVGFMVNKLTSAAHAPVPVVWTKAAPQDGLVIDALRAKTSGAAAPKLRATRTPVEVVKTVDWAC